MTTQLSEIHTLFQKSWDDYRPRMSYYALLTLANIVIELVIFTLCSLALVATLHTPAGNISRWIGSKLILSQQAIATPVTTDFVGIGVGAFLFLVCAFVVSAWMSAAHWIAITEPSVLKITTVLRRALPLIPRYFGLQILRNLIVGIGTLFLLIPGILFAGFFAFADITAIKNSSIASLKASHAMVIGRWWAIAGRLMLAGLLAIVIPQIILMFLPNAFIKPQSLAYSIGAIVIYVLYSVLRVCFLRPWYMVFKNVLYEDAARSKSQSHNSTIAN